MFAPIGIDTDRHFFIFGSTGAGKSTQLTTVIAKHGKKGRKGGNVVCIDVKGELSRALYKRRSFGGDGIIGLDRDVALIDPGGMNADIAPSATFNVIEEVDYLQAEYGENAALQLVFKICEALIEDDNKLQPFFSKSARMFLQGVILFVMLFEKNRPENRNLVRVRELVTQGLKEKSNPGENPFDALLYEMLKYETEYGGIIAARARSLLESSEQGRNAITATFRNNMQEFDLPGIQSISKSSSFRLVDTKIGHQDLFIIDTATHIESTCRGYFRMFVMCLTYIYEVTGEKGSNPTLLCIDEAQSLGHIPTLATAAPKLRSYGLRLLLCAQSISGLRACYPDRWRDFLGNAGAILWLGLGKGDTETPEYLSNVLGQHTQEERVGASWAPWFLRWLIKSKAGRAMSQDRALMTSGQVTRFLDPDHGNMIVTRYSKGPMKLKRIPYYVELAVYNYSPSRLHGEVFLRRISRSICKLLQVVLSPAIPRKIAKKLLAASKSVFRKIRKIKITPKRKKAALDQGPKSMD